MHNYIFNIQINGILRKPPSHTQGLLMGVPTAQRIPYNPLEVTHTNYENTLHFTECIFYYHKVYYNF